ncbi:MAG: hypothetical protein HPY59_08475 [Anaerolineae bacterium]|nr:hypothetical protein [Anaerolineae bacterium]
MAGLSYLIPRFVRHILPDSAARFLLKRGWIIRPGLETRAPLEAAQRYEDSLAEMGRTIHGGRILILGYGGKFTLGCELLRRGASHVILAEKEAFFDHRSNLALLPEFEGYLKEENGRVIPNPQVLTLLHGDIRRFAATGEVQPVDYVFSNSVYEHLGDVEGITAALARLSNSEAIHLHFVDLRDHFFKYPFEMLCYSQEVWQRWLNPTSNHNRCRLHDYRRVFQQYFQRVEVIVLERDLPAFYLARPRIRPEFLTGDDEIDSVTLIKIIASLKK